MDKFLEWLDQPLLEQGGLKIGMFLAFMIIIASVLALMIIVYKVGIKRKHMREEIGKRPIEESTTVRPADIPVLEAANMQGQGERHEQQDAFGLSLLDAYEQQGILAVLCDGMGGMFEGGRIAQIVSARLLGAYPWLDDDTVLPFVEEISADIYRKFLGHGGSTLVAITIRKNRLRFWSVGDSDLFLLREAHLYALNQRQEYKNELLMHALEGMGSVEAAYQDPQAGALLEYIGKEDVQCDYLRIPFFLLPGDTLLLCSDGVSDTLTRKQIQEAMYLQPQACCEKLEEEILQADRENQDNYTAIVLRYHGSHREEGGSK